MTRRVAHAAAVLAAYLSSGCFVGSIHPFFGESSMVMDPALVGTWVDAEDGVTIAIEAGQWSSYRIAFTDRTGTLRLTGHATRIGEREFVDVLPAQGYERGELFVPLHAAFSVEVEADTLTIRGLNYDWFRRAQSAGRLKSARGVFDVKQNVIFTGTTASIRAFLERQRDDDIFGAETTLTRKAPQ